MNADNLQIIKLPVIGSTNDYLKELAKKGECGPLVVIADEQTGGKGTKNRSFVSKKGGIYLSILLKPNSSGFDATLVTPMTAVAVSETIEQISNKNTDIKWVNDIYINGKKVCGILCESIILPDGKMPYIIVGIGVNLFTPYGGFSEEIKDIATSVFEESKSTIKDKFINLLLENFFKLYNGIENKTFLNAYRKKNIVVGKNVTVIQNDKNIDAKALYIDDCCRLVVEYPDKSTQTLSSGELSIKL